MSRKERSMKKFLFVVLMVASLVLAACGGAPAPAASTGPVEISMMMWGDPAELDVWNQIVADFHQANPSITVKVEVSDWEAYWTKLKTLLAAGTPPDVFAMDAPLYPDYQSRGVLLNIQPYIQKDSFDLTDFYDASLVCYQTPDGYYGLPRDIQPSVMYYNKDM